MLLSELCGEIRNYFLRNKTDDIHEGTYTIKDGSISLPFLKDGQFFRIVGSTFNDGVWQYTNGKIQKNPLLEINNEQGLIDAGIIPADLPFYIPWTPDETFTGAIWAMSVPPDFILLAAKIYAWEVKNASSIESPFQSESFGSYSYTKASGGGSSGSSGWTWQDQFRTKLNRYRRLSLP